jgi:hypothetical protein
MSGKGEARPSPRWDPMLRFAERWIPSPRRESNGVSEDQCDAAEARLGIKIPAAVREWYRLFAMRPDMSGDDRGNRAVPIDELAVCDGRVDLYWENQGVLSWGVRVSDWHHDDPPVVAIETEVCSLGVVNRTCSEFYFQMMLHQAKWASLSAYGYGDVAKVVAEHYPRLPLPVWPWAGEPEAFTLYGDDDTLLNFDSTYHLLVVARTDDALRKASGLLEPHWDLL